jgi:hypothetical protein
MGLLLDYVLVLLLRRLDLILLGGGLLALAGLALGARALWRARAPLGPPSGFWLLICLALALVALPILAEPIQNWDARSIWFFHAKMIYHAGSLTSSAGFQEHAFSHPDYPKLLPALAAQVAHARGFWNEFLPKTSLLLLLVPAVLGYFSFWRAPLSFTFLASLSFLRLETLLWNGQADGFLALFGGLATLSFGRWLGSGRTLDVALGVVSLGIACSLKNEGVALALCVLAAVGAVLLARSGSTPLPPLRARPLAALCAISFSGFLIWEVTERSWGLSGDIALSSELFTRMARRLFEENGLSLIFRDFFAGVGLHRALVPLALGLVLARLCKRGIPGSAWVALVAGGLYFAVITLMYLGTPNDLDWHLRTSSFRTLLPIELALYAAAFVILEAVERSDPPAPTGAAAGELRERPRLEGPAGD